MTEFVTARIQFSSRLLKVMLHEAIRNDDF